MAAPKKNKFAQEWNVENATPRFEDALKYAEENEDCLCLQDAIYQTGIPYSTFYYLCDNQIVLDSLKKNIQSAIIRRINRLAIKDIAPAAAAIWRMKQSGERDEQHITQSGTMTQIISVNTPETIKEIEKLKDSFDKEK